MHRTCEEPLGFGGIVAAEINGLADFINRVLQVAAGFVRDELHQRIVMRLQCVTHSAQDAATLGAAERVPAIEGFACNCHGIGRIEIVLGHRASVRWREECIAIGLDREIATGRVAAAGAIELRWLRQTRVTARTRFQRRDRISGDEIGRDIVIEERVHERRVGAILEQAPHKIRQQVFMTTDRRIDAHRQLRLSSGVKRLAHAVQALEFEIGAARARRHAANGGDRVRVVGCELRENRIGLQEIARAGEIVDVSRGFRGPDREIGAAHDLRALHFAIPVRAFDQARLDARATTARERSQHLYQFACALLIRLDRKTQTFPALERRFEREALKQAHRHDQAIGFFGVERQPDIPFLGALSELQYARIELAHYALFLACFVTRMQRRELHRNTVRRLRASAARGLADRVDRRGVSREITRCVFVGAGALAQHVERVARGEAGTDHAAAALQGGVDVAAEHELLAENAHRLHGAGAHDGLAQPLHDFAEHFAGFALHLFGQVHDAPGQHQAPSTGIDQPMIGIAEMLSPAASRDFLGDQFVSRLFVRHAQQSFGEAHQRQALSIGEAELFEEAFHHALAALQAAGLHDQRPGLCSNRGARGWIERRIRQHGRNRRILILIFQRVERVPVDSGGRVWRRGGLHGRLLLASGR